MTEGFEKLDEYTVVLHIEVPGSKVVLFQAFFELHEAIGIVRTIDIKRSRVCVVTTEDMLPDCMKLLEALKDQIPWCFVEGTEDSKKIFGYSRKGTRQENSYD